jgi:hypothetical protein
MNQEKPDRNSGYRGWDAWIELSGTDETSVRHGVTCRVIGSIKQPLKTTETRTRGVGGGHSTADGEDNRTSPEGRASASVMLYEGRGTV